MQLGRLGVWYFLDGMPATAAAETAQRLEGLGYSALWIPEAVGRNPLVHASWLLANTSKLIVATGIANIYHREPGVTVSAQKALAEQSGNRFLLGIGVSHKPMVEGVRGLKYGPPVATMRDYLDKMATAPYQSVAPSEEPPTLIAALGPKMLGLAREKCAGAHPYFVPPEHTALAREVLGPDKWLCVEQKIVLEPTASKARALARPAAKLYLGLPNYRNNWLRLGFSEDDLADGGSDKFIDATFAWGSVEQIQTRIQAHFDAGADHVCIQPVNPNGQFGDLHWAALEALSGAQS